MTKEKIIGGLMLLWAIFVFSNNWVYEVDVLWLYIDPATILLFLVGAWQNLIHKA